MFCPQCRAEYREGFTECSDCRVPLVAELPPEDVPEYAELATVLATGHEGIIAVAKSILDDAGITYFVKGERLQDLFAAGRIGAGFNPTMGPVEVQVYTKDEREARRLLSGLKET
jgi:hypothetical protein